MLVGGLPKHCSVEGRAGWLAGWLSPPWFSSLFFWNLLDPLSVFSGLPSAQGREAWAQGGAAWSPGLAIGLLCSCSFRLGSFYWQENVACVSGSFQKMAFLLDAVFCSETLQD